MADYICQTLKDKGLIGDEVIRDLRVEQPKVQRNYYLFGVLNFYLANSKVLVERMNAQGADWTYAQVQTQRCKTLYDQGQALNAWVVFCDLICAMMARHWPDCDDSYWKSALNFYGQGKARLAAGLPIDDGSMPKPA